MRRKIGILIAVFGVALLLSTVFLNNIVGFSSNRALSQFEKMDREDLGLKNKLYEYNFKDIEEISPSKTYLALEERDYEDIIGQLVIPSVDINVALFEGISKEKLWKGVSTMKENQVMGQGNYSIAGHYGINDELFYNLADLEIGEEIRLTDKDKIYVYRVVERLLVDPSETYMIGDSRADGRNAIISLMSCYYEDGKNTGKRLFVVGELEKTQNYSKKMMMQTN